VEAVDAAVHPHRRLEGARERLGLTEVIAVLVGRDDGIDAIAGAFGESDAQAGEPRLGLARSDAGIDEDTCPVRFHEEGVTARPGPQDEDAHCPNPLS
jgi:hypothetical protein